jgi:hypothetical protein
MTHRRRCRTPPHRPQVRACASCGLAACSPPAAPPKAAGPTERSSRPVMTGGTAAEGASAAREGTQNGGCARVYHGNAAVLLADHDALVRGERHTQRGVELSLDGPACSARRPCVRAAAASVHVTVRTRDPVGRSKRACIYRHSCLALATRNFSCRTPVNSVASAVVSVREMSRAGTALRTAAASLLSK